MGEMDGMIDSSGGFAILDDQTSDEVIAPEDAMMQGRIDTYGLRVRGKRVSSGGDEISRRCLGRFDFVPGDC